MTENDNVLSHFLSDVLLPSGVADHLIMVTFYHLYHLHGHLIPDQIAALPPPSVDDALLRDVDRLRDGPALPVNPDLQVHLRTDLSLFPLSPELDRQQKKLLYPRQISIKFRSQNSTFSFSSFIVGCKFQAHRLLDLLL